MPHFDEQGRDTVICQKCGKVVTEASWRPDITGSKSAGNVCATCESAYDVRRQREQNAAESGVQLPPDAFDDLDQSNPVDVSGEVWGQLYSMMDDPEGFIQDDHSMDY
jgi:hypothetical protein